MKNIYMPGLSALSDWLMEIRLVNPENVPSLTREVINKYIY